MNPYWYYPYPLPAHYRQTPQPYVNYYPAAFYYPIYRQFPPVDPGVFMSSAKEMEVLMKDASTLLAKMAESQKFSYELMSAAQESKLNKVESMIKSTGIKKIPKVSYTPDGFRLVFDSLNKENLECCNLTLKLRWM